MANMRTIRRQIRGVQSIAKITRAMEMIATSRMKKAQDAGLAGRPYAEKIMQVISDLAAIPEAGSQLHPLLTRRPENRVSVLHITPDRGFCGGLNANLNRSVAEFLTGQEAATGVIAVGSKGRDFIRRAGQYLHAEFIKLGDRPTLLDTLPISHMVIDEYATGKVDAVYISYARFVNTTTQTPVVERLLPVEPATVPPGETTDYIYEPGPEAVLGELLPRFVEMQVYHDILEAIASEQSARVVAMRNATDNAHELIDDLTLSYNKARQESITTELLEVTSGAAALG
jgi:F-type H+-transporting ATPase subunit gamma